MSKPRTGRNPSIAAWIESMADWHCPSCGVVASIEDTSCRWNGERWEHRCKGNHPQFGCTAMEKRPEAPPEPPPAIVEPSEMPPAGYLHTGGEVDQVTPSSARVMASGIFAEVDLGAGGPIGEPYPAGYGSSRGLFSMNPDFDETMSPEEVYRKLQERPETASPGEVIPLRETGGEVFPVTSETDKETPPAVATLFGCPVIAIYPPPGGMDEAEPPELTAEEWNKGRALSSEIDGIEVLPLRQDDFLGTFTGIE